MYGTRYGPYSPSFFQGITDLFQYSQRGFSKAGLCKFPPLINSRTNGANLGILSGSYSSGRSSLQASSHSSRSGNLGTRLSSLHDMSPVARFQRLDHLRRGWKWLTEKSFRQRVALWWKREGRRLACSFQRLSERAYYIEERDTRKGYGGLRIWLLGEFCIGQLIHVYWYVLFITY